MSHTELKKCHCKEYISFFHFISSYKRFLDQYRSLLNHSLLTSAHNPIPFCGSTSITEAIVPQEKVKPQIVPMRNIGLIILQIHKRG